MMELFPLNDLPVMFYRLPIRLSEHISLLKAKSFQESCVSLILSIRFLGSLLILENIQLLPYHEFVQNFDHSSPLPALSFS